MPITGLIRVLVIHAQLDQAVAVQKLLKPLGIYDVRPFTAAENALQYVIEDGTPDLAILDVRLRGARVLEVMAQLRRKRADLPVILVGAAMEEAERAGAQAGVESVRGRDLLPAVRRLTGQRATDTLPAVPPMTPITQPDRSGAITRPDSPPPALSGTLTDDTTSRLKAEEPAPPTLAEGGTVRQLFADQTPAPETPVIEVPVSEEPPASDPAAQFDDDDADLDSDKQPAAPPPAAPENPPLPRTFGRRKTPQSRREPPVPAQLTRTQTLVSLNPEQEAARKALRLTQAATGSTAAACILTRGTTLIGHAGEMPAEEVEELRELLKDDWDPSGKSSRIRFVTLPSSRQDYLLIARRTDDDYTLTLAFAGDASLSDIRRQSEALLRALAQAPEPEPVPVPALPMTVIWVLRDASRPLTPEHAQSIVLALDSQLNLAGWRIHNLNVHADYVYVYCDTPVDLPAGEVVARLREWSEQAVRDTDAAVTGPLWADSYLALMPGREMGGDEVRRFLRFSRMTPSQAS
jgi:CheY-like chemotaxis protein